MESVSTKPRVLYIDDEQDFLDLFLLFFKRVFEITPVTGGTEALDILERETFDVVITDYDMKVMNGLELLKEIKARFPEIPVIFHTGQGNEAIAREAFTTGASDYFTKDISGFAQKEKLQNAVFKAMEIRKATKEKLESEQKYHNYINNAPEGIMVIDAEGKIYEVNDAFLRLMGYSDSEVIQTNIFDFIAPESLEAGKKRLLRLIEEGKADIEAFFLRKDGEKLYVSVDGVRTAQENLLLFFKNITERKIMEEALQESEERLRTLINASPDIICFKDGEGRWLEANDADLKLFELTDVDYRGKKDSDLAKYSDFYRDAFLTCEDSDEIAWKKGEISSGEEVIPRPDGTSKVYDVIKIPLFQGDKQRKGLVVLGRDITERKSAEKELKNSEAIYRSLAEHSPDIIMRFDRNFRHLFSNSAVEKYVSLKKEDFIGKTHRELGFAENEYLFWEEKIQWVFDNDKILELEFDFKSKTGGMVIFNWRLIPEKDENDEIVSVLSISKDVTQDRKKEKDSESRGSILEAISIASQRFLKTGQFRETVNDVLELIGKSAQVGRVYVFVNKKDKDGNNILKITHEWISPGIKAIINDPVLKNFDISKWNLNEMIELFIQGKPYYGNLNNFPEKFKELLISEDVKSTAAAPIFVNDKWWGIIGFDECVKEREWTSTELDALKTAAAIMGESIQLAETREALIKDIGKRERVEEELRLFKTIVESSSEAIAITSPTGVFRYINPAHEKLFGRSLEEAQRLNFKDYYPPESVDILENEVIPALRKGESWEGILDVFDASGRRFPLWEQADSVKDENGNILYSFGLMHDVTNEKLVKEALKESREKYRSIVQGSPVGLFIMKVESDGTIYIRDVNPAASEILHCDATKFIGRQLEDAFPSALRKEIPVDIRDIAINGRAWHTDGLEYHEDYFDGFYKIYAFQSSPGVAVIMFEDITSRKTIEKQLIEKNSEMKDFVYRVSHDLKNPLNLIRGFSGVIKENPQFFDKYIDKIIEQTERINIFVNKLLNLSRAGKAIGKKQKINLKTLINKVYSGLDKRGVNTEVIFSPDVSFIYADSTGMEQVFTNLIDNSIKYCDPDKEKLIIEISQTITDGKLVISLKDNGSGIEECYLENIFNPGFVLEQRKGTGFGLAIIRKIVEAHNGTIIATSKGKNKGMEFIMRLPDSEA